MFVVIVSDFGEMNGGAAKVAITTARGLADRGIQILFISATDRIDELLAHPNITVETLGLMDVWSIRNPAKAAINGLWNNWAKRRISQRLKNLPLGQTIVHLHSWTKALSPSAISAISRSPHPWVVTFHDYFLFCPIGTYFNHRLSAPCSLTPMSRACIASNCDARSYRHKLVRVLRHGLLQGIIHDTKHPLNVIHISKFAKGMASRFLASDTRHYLVVNPNDTQKFRRVPVRENRDFVFIGRLQPEKGCTFFAHAAQSLGVPATFLGEGSEADAVRLACPRAEIIHWGAKDEVARVLGKARALVFPSIWYETGGLVVFEALARGVPVIASNMSGAVDAIKDGINGFLFEINNKEALIERMRWLQDDVVAEKMGTAAFEIYWNNPRDLDTYLDRLVDVYGLILSEHTKSP